MSWVRQAIDGIKANPYEELYPTAYGSSAKEPDVRQSGVTSPTSISDHFADIPMHKIEIFWALNPNDVPPQVKLAVEISVRQKTVEHKLSCAIIRLETLPGYYAPENKSTTTTDEPIGHFAIYLGTSPVDAELKTHLSTNVTEGQNPTLQSSAAAAASTDAEEENDGARTPTMSEVEDEYSQMEKKSKRASKRLSKITASVRNWVRLN